MAEQRMSRRHAETLARDGIVVVEDYMDAETCDRIRERVEEALDEGMAEARPDEDYADLVARGEPVLKRRSGERDDGMLDVFNMASVVPELEEFKTDPFVGEIVDGAADEPFGPDNVNVYVNRSVTNTRDFHADTYAGKFKSFVYLTDVPNRSYGPFTYIKGSHRKSGVTREASRLVNRVRGDPGTNAVFYDDSDTAVCTAPRGTLIVANQAGYHRGHPQEEGSERMLATTSYTPR
jgi:hypothetical protein